MDYNERVGERLRSIRQQRGMSLQDVHKATDGEFKAAVLGAYERGERSLSLPRLRRLAACYGVPINQLLPEEDTYEIPATRQKFFQPESFAAQKADDEFRIFVFGGSTVQGRPYAIETSFTTWLELALAAAGVAGLIGGKLVFKD